MINVSKKRAYILGAILALFSAIAYGVLFSYLAYYIKDIEFVTIPQLLLIFMPICLIAFGALMISFFVSLKAIK